MTEITTLGFNTNQQQKDLAKKPIAQETSQSSVFSKYQDAKKAVYEVSGENITEKVNEFIDIKKNILQPTPLEVKETKPSLTYAQKREIQQIEDMMNNGEITKKNLSVTDNIKIVNRHTKEQFQGEVTSVERGKFDSITALTVTTKKGNSFTYTYDKSTNRYKDSTGTKFYLMKPDCTLVRDYNVEPKNITKQATKKAPAATENKGAKQDKNKYVKFQATFNTVKQDGTFVKINNPFTGKA